MNIEVAAKRKRTGGKYPKITPQIALAVADLICKGMPLRYAAAAQTPPFSGSHFARALEKSPALSLLVDKRCAEHMGKFLDVMNDPDTKLRGMPASVWVWERRFSEFFAPPKTQQAGSTTINNHTTVIAIQDQVAERVASYVRKGVRMDREGIQRYSRSKAAIADRSAAKERLLLPYKAEQS